MDRLISSCGRMPQQRTTLYGTPPREQSERSYSAPALAPVVQTPAAKKARIGQPAIASR
jgi:FO synthase